MPSGGYRPGAGRKPGSTSINHTKTREIIARAAEQGLLPLDVMLGNMAFYHREADELLGRLVAELTTAGEAIATSPEDAKIGAADTARQAAVEVLRNILGLRKMAGEEAARAAPYIHARIGPVEAAKDNAANDHIPLAERLKVYAQRDAIEASAGRVVELKRPREP